VETSTQTITVIPDVNPAWTNPSPICAASGSINLNNLITGTTGGTWSGTGVSGSTFNPAGGSQSVTYTVGTAPCVETQTHTITVATVSAAWTNPSPICEGDAPINLSALVTGSAGGSFSGTGVSANTLDPSGLGGSSVTVTYTVGASPCTETQAHTIVINNDDDASFSYPQSSYCVTGNNPTPTVTGNSGGTFTISAPGSINPTTGEINLAASGTGSFTVIYNTAAAGNPCPVSDTLTITITTGQTAGFSYDNAQYCVYDNAPILTINGGATAGNFSAIPSGLTIDNAGNITLPSSTPGVYTVYNNVPAANGCAPAVDSSTIEILPLDTATFSYTANAFCLADPNPVPNVTGTPGGLFTISPAAGVINPTTGEIDINASGAGSYTVYYNTSNAGNPCPVTDSVTVTLLPQNFITPDSIANFCLGDSTALTASASGNGTITWYSDAAGTTIVGTGSPFFPPVTAAGTYTYYVNETGTCPSPMDSVTFTVQHVDAQASANPTDGPVPLIVNFSNNSTGATNYFWDFANGNLDSTFAPSQTYTEPGTYTVTLVVTDGLCWDSTTIVIEVFNESSLTIPNVFTPNGDGHNDFFTVDGENLKSVEGEIYNRWGQKMFAWGNVNGYWDGKTLAGKDAPDGTYFFIIKAEGIDGKQYFQKGTVSLIR
jgi:gliding motility-associated-like protein